MEQRKQTAVEWLVIHLAKKHNEFQALTFYHDHHEEIKQAKQMERSQIQESYCDGFDDGYLLANGEDTEFDDCYLYYQETYGK